VESARAELAKCGTVFKNRITLMPLRIRIRDTESPAWTIRSSRVVFARIDAAALVKAELRGAANSYMLCLW
jgi:hypothetical protein